MKKGRTVKRASLISVVAVAGLSAAALAPGLRELARTYAAQAQAVGLSAESSEITTAVYYGGHYGRRAMSASFCRASIAASSGAGNCFT